MSTALLPGIDPSQECPIWHELDVTLTTQMVAMWFSVLLSGIAIAQTFNYFHKYPQDHMWLKTVVLIVTLLDVVYAVTICFMVYYVLIAAHGIADEFRVHWYTSVQIGVHSIIGGIVNAYFIRSCYALLSDKKIQKPVIIGLCISSLASFGFGIATFVYSFAAKPFSELAGYNGFSMEPWGISQMAADIFITITLCAALPRPALVISRRTRKAILSIMMYTATRGILVSVAALVQFIALRVAPHSFWFAAPQYILTGLYTNSLLSSLNTRKRIRKCLTGSTHEIKMTAIRSVTIEFRKPSDTEDITAPCSVDISHMSMEEEVPVNTRNQSRITTKYNTSSPQVL